MSQTKSGRESLNIRRQGRRLREAADGARLGACGWGYCTGTRCFSSSNQFSTTLICVVSESGSMGIKCCLVLGYLSPD